ncbi:hypothetical protein [Streptomyces sp. YIM 98790]|uniref:hypothetical protein n=1 Tax=Streptomyces sp. YIM 98790 TaxID=2689077 RepID=UPI0014092C11|nr:hypothetical protein [Streptomyces sp. YIM 98790]
MTASLTGHRATGPEPAELSCYTTNLVDYLAPGIPDVRGRLAAAVRLDAGTEGGELVLSQHGRIDQDRHGRMLRYRSAGSWPETRDALAGELARAGRVLVVANTGHLPWSPGLGRAYTPHWMQLLGRDADGWLVADRFAALTPLGRQRPWCGRLTSGQLRAALTPIPEPPAVIRNRDAHALGEKTELPPPAHYRWLGWTGPRPVPAAPAPGVPVDPVKTLLRIAERLAGDEAALAAHAEDLWAAGRHHRYRLETLVSRGLLGREETRPVSDAWLALPRSVRFAIDSARRGRPRPGLVNAAFRRLADTTGELLARAPAALATTLPPEERP